MSLFALELDRLSIRWVGLQFNPDVDIFPGFSGGAAIGTPVGKNLGLCLEYRGTASRQGSTEWIPTSWSTLANAGNDEALAVAAAVMVLLYPLTCNLHQGWLGLSLEWEATRETGTAAPYLKGGLGVSVDGWWGTNHGPPVWSAGLGLLLEGGISLGNRRERHRITLSTILSPAHGPMLNRISSRDSCFMGLEATWSMEWEP